MNPIAAVAALLVVGAGALLYGRPKKKPDLYEEETDEGGEDVYDVFVPAEAEYSSLKTLNELGNVQAYGVSENPDYPGVHIVWKGSAFVLEDFPALHWEEA